MAGIKVPMARVKDKKLKQVVKVLKKEFKPSRMFLFGSRASGKPRSDSDIPETALNTGMEIDLG